METLGNAILLNSALKFYCKCCDYGTSRKSSYDDHLLSAKHKKRANGNVLESNGNQTPPKFCDSKYSCKECEKGIKNRSGLWKHKQKCCSKEDAECEFGDETHKSDELTEFMKYLMKENFEMKTMMMEQSNIMMKVIENGTHNTTTHTNSHNKAFNLNFFLNETCKDAMNITDFVESIKLQLSDLERVGEVGYVEGISNIIVKNLKDLDVTQRPVHCTDKKRETMYIKDENTWEKDEKKRIQIVPKALLVIPTNITRLLWKPWVEEVTMILRRRKRLSSAYPKRYLLIKINLLHIFSKYK